MKTKKRLVVVSEWGISEKPGSLQTGDEQIANDYQHLVAGRDAVAERVLEEGVPQIVLHQWDEVEHQLQISNGFETVA